ncbi:hypothetical protein [Phenylobacterium sp.]|uniref:hypothetical protein n=1 Tax=Phenylobacterium sp. TaxID=1871053 RepID=UPI004036AE89
MSSQLPPPPVPADADLTAYEWFPLHHKRLSQSEWWLSASDLARSRNVDLWTEAYSQVPAASLPDNDVVLAKFAGYGRDVAAWREVKAEILAAWVLCSDGRWYHPTLSEVAAEAWTRKQDEALARRLDADRKRRARSGGSAPASTGQGEDVRRTSAGPPPDVGRTSEGGASDVPGKSDGPSRKTGQDKINPPTPQNGGTRMSDGREGVDQPGARFDEALAAYPEAGRVATKPDEAQAAWAEAVEAAGGDEARLLAAVLAFAGSKGAALGDGKRVPSLQRFLREARWKAWIAAARPAWPGPAELRRQVVEAHGDDFAVNVLDGCCGWRDVPARAVTCRSGWAHEKLSRQCRTIFQKAGVEIVHLVGTAAA